MAKKEKTTSEGSEKAIDVAMKNFKGFSMKASDKKRPDFISTGHLDLDLAISYGITTASHEYDPDIHKNGGIPMGRITEFAGGEGAGKSSEAYRVVANAQKLGLKCLWIDVEHSFSHDLAAIYGVNVDELELADLIDRKNPDHLYSAEEIFDRMNDACKMGFKVIVLDSIAMLSSQAEVDNYLAEGGVGMGAIPQVLSKALKKLVNYADAYGVTVVLINQIREKIGVMFGNPEYTPGGRALKHACSVQIWLRKQTDKTKGPINMETEHGPVLVGNYSFIYIRKNRHGKPMPDAELRLPIYYEPYFLGADEIIFNEGRRCKVIGKHKETFRWEDIKGEGKLGFLETIQTQGKMGTLVEAIKAAAKELEFNLPPEVLLYKDDVKQAEVVVEDDGEKTKVSGRRKAKDNSSRDGLSVDFPSGPEDA